MTVETPYADHPAKAAKLTLRELIFAIVIIVPVIALGVWWAYFAVPDNSCIPHGSAVSCPSPALYDPAAGHPTPKGD